MGLMNDIPAQFVEELDKGHVMNIELDDNVRLVVGLTEVRLVHGDDINELLDEDVVRQLTHVLVTRDLMHRAGQHEPKGCDCHGDHNHG